jgi:hypothetical protein
VSKDYVRIEIWLSPDDPLLDFIKNKALYGEPLGRVVKRELKRLMFMDRYASENKSIASALKLAYRRAREFGVVVS